MKKMCIRDRTYTKGGTLTTVTPEEFAQVSFTADELKNANIVVNFPYAKDGDSVKVNVVVTDNDIDGEDKVVGSVEYDATFDGAVTPTPTPVSYTHLKENLRGPCVFQ